MIIETKELIEQKEIPRYNEVGFFPTDSFTTTQPFSYVELVKLIKKTPEAIGILRAIQTDICSDGYSFIGPKYKVEQVKKFLKNNRFKNEFSASVFDWLLFGNGALWKGKIDKSKFKEAIKKINSISQVEIKESEIKEYMDEELHKSRMLKCAPWSTMNIEMNKQKTYITGYHQLVQGEKINSFTVDEIIHAKFMQFDGRVYGFSPIESSINILTTLSLIKDVNGNFFSNGGVPDWMFILPKEMAGNPNVQKLEQTLRKFKASRQKHGNLVFTGEVTPIQMNRIGEKDMDFRMLAIYYTGILALSFNMPLARVAAILGMESSQNASGTDLSEAGYWRSIAGSQDYWEDLLNTQLFEEEFGVEIKFNRGYKNDEIKEAQRDVQMFEVLDKLIQRGAVSKEYAKEKLHIPDRHWLNKWEMPEPVMGSPFGGANGSPGSSPKNMEKGTAGQARVEQKKKQAETAAERKENSCIEVEQETFMDLVNNLVRHSDLRKVDYYIDGDTYVFSISTPEARYRFTTGKSQISEVVLGDILSFGRKIKNATL